MSTRIYRRFLVGSGLLIFLVICIVLFFVFCLSSSCVLYAQCCQSLWIVHYLIAPSVFSNIYLLKFTFPKKSYIKWLCLPLTRQHMTNLIQSWQMHIRILDNASLHIIIHCNDFLMLICVKYNNECTFRILWLFHRGKNHIILRNKQLLIEILLLILCNTWLNKLRRLLIAMYWDNYIVTQCAKTCLYIINEGCNINLLYFPQLFKESYVEQILKIFI